MSARPAVCMESALHKIQQPQSDQEHMHTTSGKSDFTADPIRTHEYPQHLALAACTCRGTISGQCRAHAICHTRRSTTSVPAPTGRHEPVNSYSLLSAPSTSSSSLPELFRALLPFCAGPPSASPRVLLLPLAPPCCSLILLPLPGAFACRDSQKGARSVNPAAGGTGHAHNSSVDPGRTGQSSAQHRISIHIRRGYCTGLRLRLGML